MKTPVEPKSYSCAISKAHHATISKYASELGLSRQQVLDMILGAALLKYDANAVRKAGRALKEAKNTIAQALIEALTDPHS